MKNPLFYARVSRDDLHCENQRIVLAEWAVRNSFALTALNYLQEEETTRKTRPIKEEALKRFRSGLNDGIVITRLDRFARSLQELVADVEHIISSNGRFVSVLNGMDFEKKTYNASQQLMLNIFGAFAQFEREIIRERTLEGLARARAEGKIGGRHRLNCLCGKCKQSKGIRPDWFSEKRFIKKRGGLGITQEIQN